MRLQHLLLNTDRNAIINYHMISVGLVQMLYGFILHIQVDDFIF